MISSSRKNLYGVLRFRFCSQYGEAIRKYKFIIRFSDLFLGSVFILVQIPDKLNLSYVNTEYRMVTMLVTANR